LSNDVNDLGTILVGILIFVVVMALSSIEYPVYNLCLSSKIVFTAYADLKIKVNLNHILYKNYLLRKMIGCIGMRNMQ